MVTLFITSTDFPVTNTSYRKVLFISFHLSAWSRSLGFPSSVIFTKSNLTHFAPEPAVTTRADPHFFYRW